MAEVETQTTLLCRGKGSTCGACCWGVDVSRDRLTRQLRRQSRAFRPFDSKLPNRWQALWFELRVRRGRDLIWSLLYLLPFIGRRLKQQHGRSLVCAFMGFDDESERGVGCLLHPTRYENRDVRNRRAFQLLKGVSCGDRDYECRACDRYDQLPMVQQIGFDACVQQMDWYDYTNTIRAFSCTAVVQPDNDATSAAA